VAVICQRLLYRNDLKMQGARVRGVVMPSSQRGGEFHPARRIFQDDVI